MHLILFNKLYIKIGHYILQAITSKRNLILLRYKQSFIEKGIIDFIEMKSKGEQFQFNSQDQRYNIYKQIETYRSKLTEYQQLQKEFNQINQRINASEISSSDADRLSRIKGTFDKNKQPTSKRNSHKKIKIYQLQKKLEKVSRENEQRRNTLEAYKQHHSKILWGIEDLSSKIQNEKKTSEQLKQLSQQIQNELEMNSSKVQEEVQQLEQSAKTKQQCSFQRKKLRDDIKRIRLTIHNLSNNLTEDLEFSNSEEDAIRSEGSVQKEYEQGSQDVRMYSDLQLWLSKETMKIDKLLNKHDLSQEKNQNHLDYFYSLKKEMISNQILVKHHKVTINLQSSKIQNYLSTIQTYKQSIIKRGETINQLSTKINKLQGQRGYWRGRIGVKIQQQRLVKALNTLLEQDLQKVQQKLVFLRFIKKLLQIKQI